MTSALASGTGLSLDIRPMWVADLAAANEIFRLSFGTEFGLEDPMKFRGDASVIEGRFAMYPEGCFAASIAGRLVGFAVTNHWGSVAFVGPVCVHPEFWNAGIARKLVEQCVACIDRWGCSTSGLFTNPSSPRHFRLYQDFGFWPRQLTVLMSRQVDARKPAPTLFRSLIEDPGNATDVISRVNRTADRCVPGLNLGQEIRHLLGSNRGDLIFIERGDEIDFAICHYGSGSEGGSQGLYVKFALIAKGPDDRCRFEEMIWTCNARAAQLRLGKVVIGVNTSQSGAYRSLLDAGFRGDMHGVRMHRPFTDILDEAGSYAIGDWR